MIRRAIFSITIAMLLCVGLVAGARAQSTSATEGYVDEFVVHVKQTCGLQYDNLVKKLVAANRANNGDNWQTLESVYGEGNVYRFISTRATYSDIETAQGKFMAAVAKSQGGEAGMMKLFSDLGACADSTQGILRHRRWDLSVGQPKDAAAYAQAVGSARWVRLIEIHVRPGMTARYEAMRKMVMAAQLKANPNIGSTWVSEAVAGTQGTVFYYTQLRPTLGSFDAAPNAPSMRDTMGDAAYEAYQKEYSEIITRTDASIYQVSGSLSNAPDDVAAVAPKFWRPAPAPMKAPAAKTPAPKNQ
ncbi:MAG TPA: hypothetical protein VGZ48_07660 [Candidatus Acidoferrales bacterium]|jgi:hypothetical protein|nr:hypothetical protein [Candidatus Acidoferrales bacterium]